ncbi:holdfast anchor protein HfaD [Brevundimonas sp.]
MFAAVATDACAQTPPPPQDDSVVLNEQLQLGDVIAGQTLNVVNAQSQVTTSTVSQGNYASGAVQNGSITVQSNQDMRGSSVARTDLNLTGDTAGVVNATTQASGNYLGVSGFQADVTLDATQSNTGALVSATTELGPDTARLLGGANVAASAVSNTTAVYGEGAFIDGTIDQSSSATVRSFSRIQSQYIPATANVTSEALANVVSVNSGQTSGQNLTLTQRSTGDFLEAEASANAGNSWDLAARARASANQASLYNQGGSVVVASDQQNSSFVRSSALTTAFDYGSATAASRAAGNDLSVGNNDIYLELDNTQLNTGGVDSTATFSGTNGYDAYVGADAVGNNVTGYGCSTCQGYMEVRNTQTNQGDVSATANTTVAGSGRAVITGANATGNSATFYVSRPGN